MQTALVGKGSAVEFAAGEIARHPILQSIVGNPMAGALFVLRAVWDVYPALVVIVPFATLLGLLRRDLFLWAMIIAALNFPALQWLQQVRGNGSGYLRYFVYAVPFGIILVTYCLRRPFLPLSRRLPQVILSLVAVAMFGWSNMMAWTGLEDPEMMLWGEVAHLRGLLGITAPPVSQGRQIGLHLRESVFPAEPNALVLVDDIEAADVVLFSGHPGRFVVPSSSRFTEYLSTPVGKVNFILVPDAALVGVNLVLATYPRLYTDGAPFATLEREFLAEGATSWRLYRVQARGNGPEQRQTRGVGGNLEP